MPTCARCGCESERAFRFCPECGAEPDAVLSSREQRKTVTVLFCDLVGSTQLGESLDPERLRALLARYFVQMKAIVERHGGSVEKFIGDAVMAVFGVPVAHEDDALRAVRAAAEMRDALPGLGLEGRIGVTTGPVVTGTEERLATGDAVNVAARLEAAAQPGEVLIGQPTLRLVRDAVEVEALEPLALKGKAEPVAAARLVRVLEVPERRHDVPFIGRERELAVVRDAWERVLAERGCELVTIVGEAGVGKSRLVAETVATIEARIVWGRCLPYGEGITYWPVIEVLKQLGTRPPDATAAAAIRSLLRESEAQTSVEEIAWAFRKTLEHAAAARPLVVVFDDIQWGEETFHDLIEHIALLSAGAPLLLLCMARPDLVERRPEWPLTLLLQPLDDDAVDQLIPREIVGELRGKIAQAAGGNPLFIGEILAMSAEADGEVIVPPTLHSLIAARLDQLEPAERRLLERGAIEGEVFHRGAVQALAPEEAQVTRRLAALVRKQLIRQDTPQIAGQDGFRFRHLLIRDVAYDSLPKAARADLHERHAHWLEDQGTRLAELDELLGYHFEQSFRYQAELGTPDHGTAAAAHQHLATAGTRAARRHDYSAAVRLLERATAFPPSAEIDVRVEYELGAALLWTGRPDEALRRSETIAERASAAGDRIGELCARVQGGMFRITLKEEDAKQKLATLVEQALPVFDAAGNNLALFVAYDALSYVSGFDAGLEAYECAVAHARQAGYEPPEALAGLASSRFFGTTPASDLLAWLDENEPRAGRDHFLRAYRAGTLAMLGRFDEARTILAESRAELADRGAGVLLAHITAGESVWVELWAGDPAAAAELGAEGWKLYQALGEQNLNPVAAGDLARALYALDRLDEADSWAGRGATLGTRDHSLKEMLWRQVRAKVLARRGAHAEAEPLAHAAVAICDETDMLDRQGDAYADLAEVLLLGGKSDDAAAALRHALERYERKGNVVSADRMRERSRELERAADAAPNC